MTPAGLWTRIGIGLGAATLTVLTLDVESPGIAAVPLEVALTVAAGSGAVLFVILARRRPTVRLGDTPFSSAARLAFLALWAAIEETIWRWLVLGELATRTNVVIALLASATAFGWLHSRSRLVHTATGLAFGTVYVATGQLAAAIVTHLTYNLLVAGEHGSARRVTRQA